MAIHCGLWFTASLPVGINLTACNNSELITEELIVQFYSWIRLTWFLGHPLEACLIVTSLAISQVDIAVWGHVHNYERSCAIYNSTCLGMPTDDAAGIATYNNADYKAPVQVVVGTGGFESSDFGTATVSTVLLPFTQLFNVQPISSSPLEVAISRRWWVSDWSWPASHVELSTHQGLRLHLHPGE